MSVIERTTEVRDETQVKGRRRPLVILLVIAVALAGLGIGIWVAGNGEGSVPEEEIQQLLDDYLGAWETKDEAGFRSAVTEEFVLNEYVYSNTDSLGFRLDYHLNPPIYGVVNQGFRNTWAVEHVGDLRVTGEGPWFVSVEEHWQTSNDYFEGQANYTIVEMDGDLQVANHYWAGLRTYDRDR